MASSGDEDDAFEVGDDKFDVAQQAIDVPEPLAVSDTVDAGGEDVEPERIPTPAPRRRGSSFAVLDALAVSRIQRFEQIVADTAAEEKKTSAEVLRQNKFAGKLAKFQKIESSANKTWQSSNHHPTGAPAPAAPIATVNNDEFMRKATLKAKLAAFEAANKKDPVAFKKTWKHVADRPGMWRQKTQIAGGIAPKKSL